MSFDDVYHHLDVALMCYKGETPTLMNISSGAKRWFPELKEGQTLSESFPNANLRRVLRKISRGNKCDFITENLQGEQIECRITPLEDGLIIHGFINHKHQETVILLQTYSKEIEEKNKSLVQALASSSRLTNSIEQSHIPSLFLSSSHVITYLNDAAKTLLSHNTDIFQIVDPFLEQSLEHIKELSSFEPKDCPHSFLFERAGIYLKGSISFVETKSHKDNGFFLQISDVTKEEEAMSHSAAMKFMVEKMSLPCMIVQPDGTIQYCNRAIIELFHKHWPVLGPQLAIFEPSELISSNVSTLFENIPSLETHENFPTIVNLYISSLIFEVQILSLVNHSGTHIGFSLEWTDGNAQRIYREEVSQLLNSFQKGMIHVQPNSDACTPFFAKILSDMEEIVNTIRQPLIDLQSRISSLSNGVLDQLIEEDYQGNLAFLKANWNNSMTKLSMMISIAVEKVVILNEQIEYSEQLSRNIHERNMEQDRKLKSVRSFLSKFSAEYKQKAEQIQKSLAITEQSERDAYHEEKQIQNLHKNLIKMEENAQKVTSQMGIIEEMAFESHLLALNTAVEASKNGEQGQGFSVIAQKMHSLSQRSREASEKSRPIIENMLSDMVSGLAEIEKTSETLTTLSRRAHQVHSILKEVVSILNSQIRGFEDGLSSVENLEKESVANQHDIRSMVEVLVESNILLHAISEGLLSFQVYQVDQEPKTIGELREAVEQDPSALLRMMKKILC